MDVSCTMKVHAIIGCNSCNHALHLLCVHWSCNTLIHWWQIRLWCTSKHIVTLINIYVIYWHMNFIVLIHAIYHGYTVTDPKLFYTTHAIWTQIKWHFFRHSRKKLKISYQLNTHSRIWTYIYVNATALPSLFIWATWVWWDGITPFINGNHNVTNVHDHSHTYSLWCWSCALLSFRATIENMLGHCGMFPFSFIIHQDNICYLTIIQLDG